MMCCKILVFVCCFGPLHEAALTDSGHGLRQRLRAQRPQLGDREAPRASTGAEPGTVKSVFRGSTALGLPKYPK